MALSPLISFEFKHNFYQIRTLFFHLKYFKPSPGYRFGMIHYYLFPGIPVIGFILGWFLNKIKLYKKIFFKTVVVLLLVISVFFMKIQFLVPDKNQHLPIIGQFPCKRK